MDTISTYSDRDLHDYIVTSLLERKLLEQNICNQKEDSSDISLGIHSFRYQTKCGLLIDNWKVVSTPKFLFEIANNGNLSSPQTYLYRSQYLVELCSVKNYNPILYNAYRDIFPPRTKNEQSRYIKQGHEASNNISYWYADLVEYLPGVLPTGELFRSTGHWNSEHQIEIFETLIGKVCIIIAGYTPKGEPYLFKQICSPGHLCLIPPGAWHLTYVLDGPALVFNIYTEPSATDIEVRRWQTKKYEWRPPVEVSLIVDDEHQTNDPQMLLSKEAKQEWKNEYLKSVHSFQKLLPKTTSLPTMFLFSHSNDLKCLEEEIIQHWQLETY